MLTSLTFSTYVIDPYRFTRTMQCSSLTLDNIKTCPSTTTIPTSNTVCQLTKEIGIQLL